MPHEIVIALDVEGTLISNAVSQFPRPGLHDFLLFCHDRFKTIYLYTAVPDSRCHAIVYNLVKQSTAPAWLSDVLLIQWDRDVKDLRNIPDVSPSQCLIVDDNPEYIHADQTSQWIAIEKFAPPYPDTDRELKRVESVIRERLTAN